MRPTLRVLVAASVALLGMLALGSAWVATGLARDALVHEVQQAERLAANERAAEVDTLLGNSRALLTGLVSRPSFEDAYLQRDVPHLEADLGSALGRRGLVGASVLDASGAVVADVGVHTDGERPLLELTTDVVSGGELRTRFVLTEFIPRVVAPLDGFDGAVSLVRRDGTVLASGLPGPLRLEAPRLQPLLATGGSVAYRSSVLGEHRIAAVSPLANAPWALVISAPASRAHRSAVSLVRHLSAVLSLTALLAAGVVTVLVRGIGRSGRQAEARRRVAEAEALTDPLTGLANRRRLEQAVAEGAAAARELTMVLVDVDRFKDLNDGLGHVAGDEALRLVAATLVGAVRSDDLVVRWGGDEFAVLLKSAVTTTATVERLRSAVEAVEVSGFGSLRCSVGVTRGPADLGELLRAADMSLYRDKREAAASR